MGEMGAFVLAENAAGPLETFAAIMRETDSLIGTRSALVAPQRDRVFGHYAVGAGCVRAGISAQIIRRSTSIFSRLSPPLSIVTFKRAPSEWNTFQISLSVSP